MVALKYVMSQYVPIM